MTQLVVKRTGMGFGGAAKQVPYAMARALNKTNTQGQAAVLAGVHARFIVRNGPFIKKIVKIGREDRATKQSLVARTRIIGPEGSEDRGDVLARHEVDAVHTRSGGNPIFATETNFYIPTENLRITPQEVIPRNMYPKNLRIETRKHVTGTLGPKGRITRHGTFQLQGKRNTFQVNRPNSTQPLGIFERFGPRGPRRDDNIHMIWYFSKRVHIHARLHFGDTFTENYKTNFKANVSESFAQAFKTAR